MVGSLDDRTKEEEMRWRQMAGNYSSGSTNETDGVVDISILTNRGHAQAKARVQTPRGSDKKQTERCRAPGKTKWHALWLDTISYTEKTMTLLG